MKRNIIIITVLLGIFLIPKDVFAETVKICQDESCEYNSIDEYVESVDNLPKDLIIELGEGEYSDSYRFGNVENLEIKGISKDRTIIIINNSAFMPNKELILENITINSNISFRLLSNKVEINNCIFNNDGMSDYYAFSIDSYGDAINLENVDININGSYKVPLVIFSPLVNIKNLNIKNKTKLEYGLFLNGITEGIIDGLTVNNAETGLYVQRKHSSIKSSIEVNNSNLLNTNCSCFNTISNISFSIPMSNINNKDYQVVFNNNNKLNCAVSSGYTSNTFISANNILSTDFKALTLDKIDYDDLTGTAQNVNDGTVDIAKKYKEVITIEQGGKLSLKDIFKSDIDYTKISWKSNDDSISIVDINDVLGLKEGKTTITGISEDNLSEYEIEVTVIINPVTNSSIYIGIGISIILILSTVVYIVYTKRKANNLQ